MKIAAAFLFALALLAPIPAAAQNAPGDYALQPRLVAPDTWVLVGAREDFNRRNGGNIVNTAFIATGDGVVVIDSGPTRRYGEAMRAAIAMVTKEPVREVWLTHHHPDHAFGNQAFADRPILALESTRQGLAAEGGAFVSNLYRMTGDWAKGTELHDPTGTLAAGERAIGRHRFRLFAMSGHTGGDLAVLDETTGVLFAGDLVFNDRAPTTPHADLATWQRSLDALSRLDFKVLVPGHGEPVSGDAAMLRRPIEQTRRWLTWIDGLLRDAAANGLDASEVAARPLPAEFAAMPLARSELVRSLAHLFRQMEAGALK
jgi:quinoprotein relay system zinc metallohydrolase 1